METYILLFSGCLVCRLDSWVLTRKVSGWITLRFREPESSWNLPLRSIVIPRKQTLDTFIWERLSFTEVPCSFRGMRTRSRSMEWKT